MGFTLRAPYIYYSLNTNPSAPICFRATALEILGEMIWRKVNMKRMKSGLRPEIIMKRRYLKQKSKKLKRNHKVLRLLPSLPYLSLNLFLALSLGRL
ncbi:Uncharacterised protein [uncultured archaeon]|nr:Uncharacterised protein [uncultured archaeon]